MRVLIADRNARLLESISKTFAHAFTIQTETTLERCNDLLLRSEFDLVIISEKLADGRGLQLLGRIARDSPDTLRVFAARPSRLELLKGKLGPFGLFRTLTYPINPQKLLSALTLARTGLEMDGAAPETRDVPVGIRQADKGPAEGNAASLPIQMQHAKASLPAPTAAARPTNERIRLTSADAIFASNVPMMLATKKSVPRSNVSSAPRDEPVARQAQGPASQSALPKVAEIRSPAPPHQPLQGEAFQLALESGKAANKIRAGEAIWRYPQPKGVLTASTRSKLVLGATVAAVFLVVMKLTLNLGDKHVALASAPRPEMQRRELSAPAQNIGPVSLTRQPPPAPAGTPRVEPRPSATPPIVESEAPQVAGSTVPLADPSTFGSEAYEPIYTN